RRSSVWASLPGLPCPGPPTNPLLRRGHVAPGGRRRAAARTATAASGRLHQHLELRDLRVAQHVRELADDGVLVRLTLRAHLFERQPLTRRALLLAFGLH